MSTPLSTLVTEQHAELRRQFPRSLWELIGVEACGTCGGTGTTYDILPLTDEVDFTTEEECADCLGTGRADCAGAEPQTITQD